MGYFVVIRYVHSNYLEVVTDGTGNENSDKIMEWETEEEAQEWILNNALCQSGQGAAEAYEAP